MNARLVSHLLGNGHNELAKALDGIAHLLHLSSFLKAIARTASSCGPLEKIRRVGFLHRRRATTLLRLAWKRPCKHFTHILSISGGIANVNGRELKAFPVGVLGQFLGLAQKLDCVAPILLCAWVNVVRVNEI